MADLKIKDPQGQKNKIIQATISLIEETENGCDGITIRDICTRAEVSIGRINYHFESKEELLFQIARILPQKISAELEILNPGTTVKWVQEADYLPAASLIKIMYESDPYMAKYRNLYSKSFITQKIIDLTRDDNLRFIRKRDLNISNERLNIIASAAAFSYTNLASENVYSKICGDVYKVIEEVTRFNMDLLQIGKDEQDEKIEKVLSNVRKLKYNIKGLVDIEFINE